MRWANGWWSSSALDRILPWATHLGSHVAVVLFILVSWSLTRQKRVFLYLVLLYGIQSFVIYSLKYLVKRERPLLFPEMASKLARGPGEILDPTFPSAHTVLSFMMATLLAAWFPRYAVLFYLVAGLIGWTRIYLGLHYPTDILAGALLGYGITKVYSLYFLFP